MCYYSFNCVVGYRRRRGNSWLMMPFKQVSTMTLDQAAM
jgi:hypothetical protein